MSFSCASVNQRSIENMIEEEDEEEDIQFMRLFIDPEEPTPRWLMAMDTMDTVMPRHRSTCDLCNNRNIFSRLNLQDGMSSKNTCVFGRMIDRLIHTYETDALVIGFPYQKSNKIYEGEHGDTFLLLPFHKQKQWLCKKFLEDEVFMENLEKGTFLRDQRWREAFAEGKDKYFVVSKRRPFLNKESARIILVRFKMTYWT
ncbi:hypothetical protein Q3G72_021267 [Acer saccharum]|nr:hypothetical protein Q3G72_021267 [Acer saccharum]